MNAHNLQEVILTRKTDQTAAFGHSTDDVETMVRIVRFTNDTGQLRTHCTADARLGPGVLLSFSL